MVDYGAEAVIYEWIKGVDARESPKKNLSEHGGLMILGPGAAGLSASTIV